MDDAEAGAGRATLEASKMAELERLKTLYNEDQKKIAELERLIGELRRETLLPCRVCQSGEQREWAKLADTLLLVEPIWNRSKETKINLMRPKKENLNLEPLQLVLKSSKLVEELQGYLDRCERLQTAAEQADSSLFSLFPFSAGTFQRLATREAKTKRDYTEKAVAVQTASDLLMEMARTLLEQRLEINGYIEELVQKTVEKEKGLGLDKLPHPNQTSVMSAKAYGKPIPTKEESMDDFLFEQEFEEDAAEVEL